MASQVIARSICLSCTKFIQGDTVGQLLASLCFAPYIVLMYIAAAAHATRDITAIMVGIGALLNTGLSIAVKRVVKQPRPAATCHIIGKCHKYGMPSSHAQVLAFATTTLLLMHLHRRKNRSKSGVGARKTFFIELFELALLSCVSATVSYARVYLGYHSVQQVLAGIALGALFAIVWFCAVVRALQESGVASNVVEVFSAYIGLRSTWHEPGVAGLGGELMKKKKTKSR